jgi:polyisoprenyl-phosphate glycosyltransferase
MTTVPSTWASNDSKPVTGELPAPGLRAVFAAREFALGHLSLAEATTEAGLPTEQFLTFLSRVVSLGENTTPATATPVPAAESRPRISIVIPVYNEEENLPVLHDRLAVTLEGLGSYEILFVDDGSRDRSTAIVEELKRRDPGVKLLSFSRNFGHQAALSAGLDAARGEAVVFMDADLQDPPELLPELVRQWQDGADVVYAVRRQRNEGLFKRSTAAAFYRLLRRVADIEIPVDTGDFCLMDRSVADVLRNLPERNRFLRGLRSWAGFRQVGVPYDRPARHAGEPKYTLRKMVGLALNGVMAFTSLPLRLASYLGFLTMAGGLAYLAWAVGAQLTAGGFPDGWTSLVALILLVGGAQLLMLGVLGAYVARIYDETKSRPMYVLRETGNRRSPR